ncbi:MAG: HD domain-containing protein [Candidatus Omnitrophica bacterium]|nr:HD domain-containing protein [Candidatus Omnitrophota bacterium]
MPENRRVLLINDDEELLNYVKRCIPANEVNSVVSKATALSGLEACKDNSFHIVIAKFGLPDLAGPQLIKELKKINPDAIIIAYVEEINPELLSQLTRLGVYDSITRPINTEKLSFLINKAGDLAALGVANRKLTQSLQEHNTSLQRQNTLLAKRIEESTKNLSRLYEDLRSTYMRTIKALAQAIDARDHYTHSHSETVAKYAVAIAQEMGLSAKDIEVIREACELHDLGKIGIEDNILLKPAKLTPEEWDQMKRHPLTGAQILEPLTFLNGAIDLVKQHHEHYDGTGYPEGRRGEDVLLGARIIHLADAYEAMRTPRSYRKIPFSKEQTLAEIKKNSGTQFDPKVVEAFLRIVDTL